MGGFWCVFTTHPLFFCLWTFRLFLPLGHCESCCNDHGNTGVFFSIPISIPLDKYPEVGLLEYSVSVFFWGTSILFSISGYITNRAQEFHLLHIFVNTYYFLDFFFFIMFILSGVDTSLWLWLPFPSWWIMLNVFSYTCW